MPGKYPGVSVAEKRAMLESAGEEWPIGSDGLPKVWQPRVRDPAGGSWRLRSSYLENKRRHDKTHKGKESRARYLRSNKGKITVAKYNSSNKGKATKARYLRSNKGKITAAKYNSSNKGKATKARYEESVIRIRFPGSRFIYPVHPEEREAIKEKLTEYRDHQRAEYRRFSESLDPRTREDK